MSHTAEAPELTMSSFPRSQHLHPTAFFACVLFQEIVDVGNTDLLTVAKAYQDATAHHKKRPPEETWVVSKDEKKEK